jgi:hypothetical protein
VPDAPLVEPSPLPEKLGIALAVTVLAFGGYYWVGLHTDPARAIELRTPLDGAIPFLPWSEHLYAWLYTAAFYPVFCVRDQGLFRRVGLAYLVLIASALAMFVALPVTSLALRGDVSHLDPRSFTNWGIRLNYFLDPPYNLFPSLHLAVAIIAALSAGTARAKWGWLALPLVVAVGAAICTTKQHFVLDGVAAVALALAVWATVLRPYRARFPADADLAYGWRAPVGYLALHGVFYAIAAVLFLAGWKPFP